MKKFLTTTIFLVTFAAFCAISASAVENNTVRVGLKYADGALFSANLENAVGDGYALGYYDDSREFVRLGETDRTAISVTASGTIYVAANGTYSDASSGSAGVMGGWHVQLDGTCADFDEASAAAESYDGGYPAYIGGEFVVRAGCYESKSAAASAAEELGGSAVGATGTGVLVTATKTKTVLFEFDCQGAVSLAVQPDGQGEKAVTWFKGYKYHGSFEYDRITGGYLNVINVVELEDYVKGVIPYEMSGDWPKEALKAQAVAARTYVCKTARHLATYGFDVCNTTDCQMYCGVNSATAVSDGAVDDTAGECLYYDGELAEAVYSSSDGGATEDAENVWGNTAGYLIGKKDPYEADLSIPNYTYTVTYTTAQLTWVLQNSGYSIGTIRSASVSEFTPMGNVYKVTFTDTAGKTLTLKGEKCRTAFYSATYGKSVRSMRFTISGGSSAAHYVNSASNPLSDLSGAYVISGSGTVGNCSPEDPWVITASGTAALTSGSSSGTGDIVITGTGNGHNVGMSQYGANAMARRGCSYLDILNFYYTDVTIG